MTNNLTIRQIGNDILETPVKVTKFTNLSQIKKDIAILLQ